MDEFKEGLRDYQLGMFPKLGTHSHREIFFLSVIIRSSSHSDLAQVEDVYKSVLDLYPNYLPAHMALCQKLDSTELKSQMPFTYKSSLAIIADVEATKQQLQRVIKLCDIVITETDATALLMYYGFKTDIRADAAKIKT